MERTKLSEAEKAELRRWDREIVWHAFTQMAEYEPLLIERAHGCTLVDVDGREYLDGVSSLWCNVHGHKHPAIDSAIREQLDRVAHTTGLGASNPTTVAVAKRLVDLAPDGLNHVFFSDDGATAVEIALKMAVQYWQQRADPKPAKNTFVALGDAYHGDTLGGVSVGGVARFQAMFRPLLFDVLRLPLPTTYRRPPAALAPCGRGERPQATGEGVKRVDASPPHPSAVGGHLLTQGEKEDMLTVEQACAYYLQQAEELLEREHDRIAAVVIEPLVQCAAGMVTHPPSYLRGLRELTRRYDVLLIADEVAVGFGRTGTMFACEHEQVSPDLLCLAKGLTGGYLPMAATLATTEIWNAFLGDFAASRQFYHGHTYGGNPLAAAAALASLQVFETDNVLANLQPKIARLSEHLARIARHPHVGDLRQRGMLAGIELVRDRATAEPYPWSERRGQRVCDFARSQGVLLRPLGNVVVVMPPLAIALDELDRILLAIEKGIEQACV
jgi:adenosylmethionine-8-amino-7-oxononanoate aminotransferase